ncbi:MAG: SUMF1/EgtB/PvdO family nonheme iron enzyme [bacterium]|nr:SUMF1/EgtB/PvdO family nonheme iron enzyme [bacterium]
MKPIRHYADGAAIICATGITLFLLCCSGAAQSAAVGAQSLGMARTNVEVSGKSGPKGEGDFGITSIVRGTMIGWEGEAGLEYAVWWSHALAPPLWQEVARFFARTSGPMSFFDTAQREETGFYRIERSRPMIVVPGTDGGGVDHDFCISKYEVTTTEFAAFLSDLGFDYYRWRTLYGKPMILGSGQDQRPPIMPVSGWEDHPIQDLSYEIAVALCNWLSEQQGLEKVYDEVAGWAPDISKNGYRLPTTTEWYKAASWDPTKDDIGGFWRYGTGGDKLRYFDGSLALLMANYSESGDPYEYAYGGVETTPIGFFNGSTYRPYLPWPIPKIAYPCMTKDTKSHYGCYDMEGNVSEFVMIQVGGAFEPGVMGSHWGSAEPSWWDRHPTSEVRPVSDTTHPDLYVGFRLARTAVQAAGAD